MPPSSQGVVTAEPSSRTIGDEERSTRDTTGDDERDVNEDNAPIGNGDGHMQGSQNGTNLEQPCVDTQACQGIGDTLLVDADGVSNFTGARPEPVSMMRPGEGGTIGADLAVEEVINL